MVIVCGTDLTQASFEAARAAAALGARVRTPVHLVHVVDFPLEAELDEVDRARGAPWRELFEPELRRRASCSNARPSACTAPEHGSRRASSPAFPSTLSWCARGSSRHN